MMVMMLVVLVLVLVLVLVVLVMMKGGMEVREYRRGGVWNEVEKKTK